MKKTTDPKAEAAAANADGKSDDAKNPPAKQPRGKTFARRGTEVQK